jgi:hypothetical protein
MSERTIEPLSTEWSRRAHLVAGLALWGLSAFLLGWMVAGITPLAFVAALVSASASALGGTVELYWAAEDPRRIEAFEPAERPEVAA